MGCKVACAWTDVDRPESATREHPHLLRPLAFFGLGRNVSWEGIQNGATYLYKGLESELEASC
jgi:hypothetical protein